MASASRQRTFELVPNAPQQRVGNDPSPIFSKPPMTSKQAKKLHNQKNKGPKLSKAELRRIELLEQDRIRKEFEKEKVQARARAARDKKKAKEDKEKEERKRKGLPLKDIHPSQDTISRFLNRMGAGRKQDSTTTNSRLGTVDEEDSETATEAGDSGTEAGEDNDDLDKENQAPVEDESGREAKRIRLSQAHENQQTPFSQKLQSEVPAEAAVSLALKAPSQPRALPPRLQPQQTTTPVTSTPPLPEAHTAGRNPSHLSNSSLNKTTSPYVRPRPPVKPADFLRVPNGPPKFKTPAARPRDPSERPKFIPKHLASTQSRNCPPQRLEQSGAYSLPQSTQAFLFDHADDFFPSPTQEAREVADDSLPKPLAKPRASLSRPSVNGPTCRSATVGNLSGLLPAEPAAAAGAETAFDSSCLSTQDLMISTQDMLDIDTPSKAAPASAFRVPLSQKYEKQNFSRPRRAQEQDSPVPISTTKKAAFGFGITGDPHRCEQQFSFDRNSNSKVNEAAAHRSSHSQPGNCRSQGHRSSCPPSHKAQTQPIIEHQQDDPRASASRPPRPPYQRHAARAAQQRSTPTSSKDGAPTTQASDLIDTPKARPKKRMFGSSGPGAEGLVAMERSLQTQRREERLRHEELQIQARLTDMAKEPAERLISNLMESVDALLDGNIGSSLGKGASSRPDGQLDKDTLVLEDQQLQPKINTGSPLAVESRVESGGRANPAASQETDYGDFDGDDLDFLIKGDTSWLDEDLDGI